MRIPTGPCRARAARSRRLDAVAHTADRLDLDRGPEAAAQPEDADVDDVAAGVLWSPDVTEQLVAVADCTGVSHEVCQQGELALRQRHFAALDGRLAAVEDEPHSGAGEVAL